MNADKKSNFTDRTTQGSTRPPFRVAGSYHYVANSIVIVSRLKTTRASKSRQTSEPAVCAAAASDAKWGAPIVKGERAFHSDTAQAAHDPSRPKAEVAGLSTAPIMKERGIQPQCRGRPMRQAGRPWGPQGSLGRLQGAWGLAAAGRSPTPSRPSPSAHDQMLDITLPRQWLIKRR